MTETIDDVIVVGGGDVGLITALAIDRLNTAVDVTVVDDFDGDAPAVGKSTYRDIMGILHGTLGIDERQFIAAVKPIWKTSAYFRDWCDRQPFQYSFDPQQKFPTPDTPDSIEHYYYHYDELIDSHDHLTRGEQIVAQEQSPWYFDASGDLDRYDEVAYNLNTERFAAYLQDICRDRDVALIDDRIVTVETTGDHIDAIRSESQRYEADLYVDATGFKRILRGEQDATFRDFAFPLDSAYNVWIDRPLSEVVPATVIESGEYGWFWHIDTYEHRDLGYVYASEFIDDEAAFAEFRAFVDEVAPEGVDPTVSQAETDAYEFTSGYYERAWLDNCLAIGNAQGFVEPLEATNLTANATAATSFAKLVSAHGRLADDNLRTAYNDWTTRMWESIYDFISVHYKYSSGDTEFWEAMSSMSVSPRVERIAEAFDRHGYNWTGDRFTGDDDLGDLQVFQPPDFYTIMANMGATSEFYEANDFTVSEDVKRQRDTFYEQTAAQVEDHLTAKELYKGMLDL